MFARRNRGRTFTLIFLLGLAPSLRAEGIPCWAFCNQPPKIQSEKDVGSKLRCEPNAKLNRLARWSGFFTTYAGKYLGIRGWRNYRRSAVVSGRVVHSASSSDGLYTIDLEVSSLVVDSVPVDLDSRRYIRIEMFPHTRKHPPLPLHEDCRVKVSGTLMWDADGFLEIHPQKAEDLQVD